MKSSTQMIAIFLIAVISFLSGFAGSALQDSLRQETPAPSQEQAAAETGDPKEIVIDTDITVSEAIAEKAMPSVVGISTVMTMVQPGIGSLLDPFGNFGDFFGFGGGQEYETTAVGTGVIVDKAGYILTNSHVVNDGDAKSVTVSLYDGTSREAQVLWHEKALDLAVLKIEKEDLLPADLGDSDTVKIGSYAAAIGNPLGLEFERSMSQGIISGLNRTITVTDGTSQTTMEGLIQTDATINSGNSGGPLFNAKGEVIGINTAKAQSGEGMGFAIPINVAKPIVDEIKATGAYERPYLGITGVSLQEQALYSSEALLEQFGTDKGIYVATVPRGSELRKEDIITHVNGAEVGSMNKLNQELTRFKVGDKVTLTVMRDKTSHEITAVLQGASESEGKKE